MEPLKAAAQILNTKKNRHPEGRRSCQTDLLLLVGTVVVVAIVALLFGLTAGRAAQGLVGETFLFVKFLFAFGEREFLRAVFANQSFVWHGFLLVLGTSDIRV